MMIDIIFVLKYQKNCLISMKRITRPVSKNSTKSQSSTHSTSQSFRKILKRRNDSIIFTQQQEKSKENCSKNDGAMNRENQIKNYVKKMKHYNGDQSQVKNDQWQDDDCISVASSISFVHQPRRVLQAKTQNTNRMHTQTESQIPILSLDELQERIENLISQKLNKLAANKQKYFNFKIKATDQFSQELDRLIKCVRFLKQREQHSNEDVLNDLTGKIILLQKVMASGITEAQVLKNYYYSIISQRNHTTSYQNKKDHIIQIFKNRKSDLGLSKNSYFQKRTSLNPQKVVNNETTATYCFKRPSKESYIKGKENNQKPYTMNNQPMQRSMYNSQFLNYGYVPNISCKPKDAVNLSVDLSKKESNYQCDFNPKGKTIAKRVSYVELDCFKDKFRQPKISFMNQSKKKPPIIEIKQKQEIQPKLKLNLTQHGQNKIPLKSPARLSSLKSQTQRSYEWPTLQKKKSYPRQSQIKNLNLRKIHQNYRRILTNS